MMSEEDGVVVELEGVGVGQRDGKHRQELVLAEAGEHFGEGDEGGEELQHGDGDVDCGRDLGQVEQHLRQICSLHYSITTNKFSIHAMSFLFLISDQAPQLKL